MQSLALYIGFGLVTASILCLGAVSFTLQFGISNLFNLAFGATMTAAAFVAYICNSGRPQHLGISCPRAACPARCSPSC